MTVFGTHVHDITNSSVSVSDKATLVGDLMILCISLERSLSNVMINMLAMHVI